MADREIEYLDLGDILDIYDFIMERTGFPSAPLRAESVLAGAIARPQNAAYYAGADLLTQACILMVSISQAQAFADGNKRTAMAAALVFLDRNGLTFTGDGELLAVLLEEAANAPSQEQAIANIAEWMRPQMSTLGVSTPSTSEQND